MRQPRQLRETLYGLCDNLGLPCSISLSSTRSALWSRPVAPGLIRILSAFHRCQFKWCNCPLVGVVPTRGFPSIVVLNYRTPLSSLSSLSNVTSLSFLSFFVKSDVIIEKFETKRRNTLHNPRKDRSSVSVVGCFKPSMEAVVWEATSNFLGVVLMGSLFSITRRWVRAR